MGIESHNTHKYQDALADINLLVTPFKSLL